MIWKRYKIVPHLAQDTTWESNKTTINITNKSQGVSPFPAGDHNHITQKANQRAKICQTYSTQDMTECQDISIILNTRRDRVERHVHHIPHTSSQSAKTCKPYYAQVQTECQGM